MRLLTPAGPLLAACTSPRMRAARYRFRRTLPTLTAVIFPPIGARASTSACCSVSPYVSQPFELLPVHPQPARQLRRVLGTGRPVERLEAERPAFAVATLDGQPFRWTGDDGAHGRPRASHHSGQTSPGWSPARQARASAWSMVMPLPFHRARWRTLTPSKSAASPNEGTPIAARSGSSGNGRCSCRRARGIGRGGCCRVLTSHHPAERERPRPPRSIGEERRRWLGRRLRGGCPGRRR
jgi:hypothetical protein